MLLKAVEIENQQQFKPFQIQTFIISKLGETLNPNVKIAFYNTKCLGVGEV